MFIFALDDSHVVHFQDNMISSLNVDSLLFHNNNTPIVLCMELYTKLVTQLDRNSFILVDTINYCYHYTDKTFVNLGLFPKINIIKTLTNTSIVYSYHNALYYYDINERIHKRIRCENAKICAILVLSNGYICYAIMDKYNTEIIIVDVEGNKHENFVCSKSRTIVLAELEPFNIYIGLDSGFLCIYNYSTEIYSTLCNIPDDCPITHIVNVSKDVFVTGNYRGAVYVWDKSCKHKPVLLMQNGDVVHDMLVISDILVCRYDSEFIVRELDIANHIPTRVYKRTQKIKHELCSKLALSCIGMGLGVGIS